MAGEIKIVESGVDHPEEACGIFGIMSPDQDVARLTYYGLYALQHRGQEGAGIAVSDGERIGVKKGMGLVSEVFPTPDCLPKQKASLALGHVRYSTSRSSSFANIQPLLFRYRHGCLAVAHNGNLLNGDELRQRLEADGSIFQTETDSELIAHLIARYGHDNLIASLKAALPYIHGAFCFAFMTDDILIGLRDPLGIRPLSIGRLGKGYILASETCAFDTVGAEFVRDLAPGEMVVIDKNGLHAEQVLPSVRTALCIFEFIYFTRPDSNFHKENVHLVRKALGRQLAKEHPVDADIVTGVPDSSLAAASGYAEEIGIPYEMALIKNRYIGRTFIKPIQDDREFRVGLKLNPVRKIIAGKKVVIVDDSIVRGTTSLRLVNMLRQAGAKEVHMRISSPPVIAPCFYGINTPSTDELIAAQKNVQEIKEMIGADSLAFLSRQGMLDCFNLPPEGFCLACFSGEYPI
ncbi:MAG: amidophosphoribosyltransferase [Firmicutes bacterium]|nr:amidophosphoribosyltransferase [Bacillota bacterium]